MNLRFCASNSGIGAFLFFLKLFSIVPSQVPLTPHGWLFTTNTAFSLTRVK